MENDPRYPYTYAADFVRNLVGYGEHGMKLSRSDASKVRQGIADALGISDYELTIKLADYYKSDKGIIAGETAKEFAVRFIASIYRR